MTVTLTGADRCDRCNATAGYAVALELASLLLCVHHWRKHYPSMADKGWSIVGSNPDVVRPQEESHG